MLLRISAVALIFFGEALSIAAELIASKKVAADTGNFVWIFLGMFGLIVIGGTLLILGYMLGYLHLKNIWIIAAISVGSILVVEPIMAILLFKQLPTAGAAVGLLLGVLGIICAMTF